MGEVGSKLEQQTSKLEMANGRTADVIAIADACDARKKELLSKKRWPW